jgi:lipopolysaccharide biosynthesis regulator YciM
MSILQRLRTVFGNGGGYAPAGGEPDAAPDAPGARDALSAIRELSQAVHNDPNAVEIYLALGNLYRQQGDIERAVHIRNTLIVRPGLALRFKARALFELGRDFKRSGVIDRAQQAFSEARALGANPQEVTLELAQLAADTGNFVEAAQLYAKLRNPAAQAHYLTRHAEELLREGHSKEAKIRHGRAIRVYSGAVEAWIGLLLLHLRTQEWRAAKRILRNALENTEPSLRFLFFEGILSTLPPAVGNDAQKTIGEIPKASVGGVQPERLEPATTMALETLERQEPELVLLYYTALFLQRSGKDAEAAEWLAKALVVRPDFWAARLELLHATMAQQQLFPVFKAQLEYFIGQTRAHSRFVCKKCGYRSNNIFYLCPRCRAWHSIAFRVSLQE